MGRFIKQHKNGLLKMSKTNKQHRTLPGVIGIILSWQVSKLGKGFIGELALWHRWILPIVSSESFRTDIT